MRMPLTGLVAAPFTAFDAHGGLKLDVIASQAASLHQHGVAAAFVCGTTGEGPSLTTEERMAVAAQWARVRPAGLQLIVHVGHASLAESEILARHADEVGADAVAALAPSFFRPGTLEDLVAVCVQIAQAASRLPFYYYHMPAMTGVDFPMASFLELASSRIPSLAGIKFTHENLMDYSRALATAAGRYDVLFGRDEILLASLALGAKGAVGSTYNYAAPIYQRLLRSFGEGDLEAARSCQQHAIKLVTLLQKYGGLPVGKAIMRLIGIDCGPTRLPLRALTRADENALRTDLERIGFFDWCSRPVDRGRTLAVSPA